MPPSNSPHTHQTKRLMGIRKFNNCTYYLPSGFNSGYFPIYVPASSCGTPNLSSGRRGKPRPSESRSAWTHSYILMRKENSLGSSTMSVPHLFITYANAISASGSQKQKLPPAPGVPNPLRKEENFPVPRRCFGGGSKKPAPMAISIPMTSSCQPFLRPGFAGCINTLGG